MRAVVYTCIVGGYDELRQPEVVDDKFDYICFTDDLSEKRRGVWEIRPIPFESRDKTILSRYVKLQPHKVLRDYDVSVWIDANITITGHAFYEAVENKVSSDCLIAQVPHLGRDCVYDEIVGCYRDFRISFKDAISQRKLLESKEFPRHFGLMENNIIFRRHNAPEVIRISDLWWEAFMAGAKRDQFYLMPVYRDEGFRPGFLLGEGISARNSDCLSIVRHPSVEFVLSRRGIRRLPLKVKWTWRKVISVLFLG